jgi:hypothetical protein
VRIPLRFLVGISLVALVLNSFSAWAGPRVKVLDNPIRMRFSSFSTSLAVLDDVTGDGIPDYLVGAYDQPYAREGMTGMELGVGGAKKAGKNVDHQGRAFVFDGQTATLLYLIDHPFPQKAAAFACSVASAGDVNQDGRPDLLIGAFGQNQSGKAYVFSGTDGAYLLTLEPPQSQPGAGFGWSVAGIGDVTGDGIPELVAGAYNQDGEGRAFVYSGRDGTLVYTLAPQTDGAGSAFGWFVHPAGDLNQDGIPDIAVGAPYTTVGQLSVQGRAYVYSGADGQLLLTLDNPEPKEGSTFGWRVVAAGDLNKDGVPDVLVGAPYHDVGPRADQGVAYALSGQDGSVIYTLHDPVPRKYSGFGWALSTSMDVNADGIPEVLVGAPFQSVDEFHIQGEVFLYNGRDGRHLMTFDNPRGHQGSKFGYAIASPGDINDDGIPEFAMSTPGQHVRGEVSVGRVYLLESQR